MKIREYEQTDLEQIMEIFYTAVHTIDEKIYSKTQQDAWANLTEKTQKQNYFADTLAKNDTLVAEQDEQIIGFIDMRNDGYLNCLYVKPSHQRKDVAQQLLKEMLKHAKQLGIKRLIVDASLIAKPFFEKNYFTVLAEQVVIRHQVELINYKMERILE